MHFRIKIFDAGIVVRCVCPPMFMHVHVSVRVHVWRPEVATGVFLSHSPCVSETWHLTETGAHRIGLVSPWDLLVPCFLSLGLQAHTARHLDTGPMANTLLTELSPQSLVVVLFLFFKYLLYRD